MKVCKQTQHARGGGTLHMKGVGMLVSLKGIKFQILIGLTQSVLGKTPSYLAVKVSFRVACEKNIKICVLCVLTWSLLEVKKSLGYAQIGLFQGFNSHFPTSIPTPFICGVPPGATCNTGQQCSSFCRGLTVNMAVKVMVAIIQRDYLYKCFPTDVSFRYMLN